MPPHASPIDDFAEFLSAAYGEVLAALRAAGLRAAITPGGTGFYLMAASFSDEEPPVDITDAQRPLPADPADVSGWHLATPERSLMVSAAVSYEELAKAVSGLSRAV